MSYLNNRLNKLLETCVFQPDLFHLIFNMKQESAHEKVFEDT